MGWLVGEGIIMREHGGLSGWVSTWGAIVWEPLPKRRPSSRLPDRSHGPRGQAQGNALHHVQ